MSAKLCGCDLEQDYVCEQHRTEPQEYGNVYERDALGGLPDETICAGKPATERAWYREHVTKTAENLMAMQPAREATPIEESLIDVQRVADRLVKELQALVASVETLQVERDMFALRSKTLEQQFADFTKVNSGWEQEHVIWRNDRRHIIDVLSAFVHAPISLSSLQPVLDLAYVLNPSLKERR